jgi:hypothetical protein
MGALAISAEAGLISHEFDWSRVFHLETRDLKTCHEDSRASPDEPGMFVYQIRD